MSSVVGDVDHSGFPRKKWTQFTQRGQCAFFIKIGDDGTKGSFNPTETLKEKDKKEKEKTRGTMKKSIPPNNRLLD